MSNRYDDHGELVQKMADTLGIDLTEEMMAGRWTPEDMQGTVSRCLGCTDPEQCRHWMEDHAKGATHTPGYCRNKDLLEKMRERLVEE
ncbi:hypothetical protein C8N32_106108 [Rhodovulum imhoffii]|uniref:DUF6455 domain-containing protein n=1 Tax=Rhodovulum imhoffii TaxID=365340 RepID=A0A2T5BT18_9RHOB|nr:DUF6455 family protein [Rhodovulum imhoffii]MBK5933820.1 hypothetical protein [Rhodovulum imhoffii]PTN02535.1 hypothetical protein C8N32_106108 [Rhodovulum imhoffii]